jgi:hypothetical protein
MRWNMEFVYVVAMLVLVGIQNLICITIGLKIGLALSKGESVSIPKAPNPIKAVKEHRANEEEKVEQNIVATILQNIENYDGTAYRQEDVPRR